MIKVGIRLGCGAGELWARGFELFRRAWHDANDEDIFRFGPPDVGGPVSFGEGAGHHHRRLGGGHMGQQLRVVKLGIADPRRAAGGELGQWPRGMAGRFAEGVVADPGDEFAAFRHYTQVGGEVGVEHLEYGGLQRPVELPGDEGARLEAEFFAHGYADGGAIVAATVLRPSWSLAISLSTASTGPGARRRGS